MKNKENAAGRLLKRQLDLYSLAKAIERCAKKAEKLNVYMGNGGDIASMLNGIANEVECARAKDLSDGDPARYL